MPYATDALVHAFRHQSEWCSYLGSPFSGAVLEQAAAAMESGSNFVGTYLPGKDGDAIADVVALRFLGCAHALALSGRSPVLAARYPSCGGDGNADGVWAMAEDAFAANADFVRGFVARPPQTNEVGRAAALLAGMLEVAALWRKPVHLFEIGASAGLLQNLDEFHYCFGTVPWGPEDAPCRMAPKWSIDHVPPVDASLSISSRRGCDVTPLDIHEPEQALRVRAYVWTDQQERLARLDGAMAVARARGTRVEAASAEEWLANVLEPATPGTARVVMHSVMWQYMPRDVQARATEVILRAGANATADTPFAWLRFEPEKKGEPVQLTLATWPGGETRRLASCHPHGTEVGWFGWEKGKRFDGPELVQTFA